LGIGLELIVLLALVIVGTALFGVFEVGSPPWRRMLKWLLLCGVTLGAYGLLGHWALTVTLGAVGGSIGYHVWWCRRHGIHWLSATPRRRYYELRGWRWDE
jgi:hypothetical protein